MGQRNMTYSSPMNDSEIEHAQFHHEPCVITYGQTSSFPQAGNSHGPLPSGIVFMAAPPPAATAAPLPIVHGMHNQLAFPSHQIINGFHGSFKGKTAEGLPVNFQYFYPVPGSSSFVAPDFNAFPVVMGPGHHSIVRNRAAGAIDGLQLMPTSHGGQPFQVMPGPWMDNTPGLPYVLGYTNGYQAMATNRNPVTFVYPHAGPHPLPPPMPPLRGSVDFHLPVVSPPQNMLEVVPRFLGPLPPAVGVRVYQPHHQELTSGSTSRHRGFPHFRVLPEDGVAMLDVSNYGRRIDHHRDMRLDIDHMTYEELLALGEHIGNVGSGLSEDFILGHLKTRIFTSSKASSSHTEEGSSSNQELTFCTVCQMDYDEEEEIGILDCSHEYHVDCINKWLAVKNSCPVCKSTALNTQENESGDS